ncbi:PadR family transcriptional regulator [Salarchaeum japonicum]|uniref:PadR family transcriptional regulator n=1 Tax=Salarchaeum japonicum TaxID=555573 RepID=A0AAV3SYL9_9EURY
MQSGLRRDVCITIAGLDDPTVSGVKRALEKQYESRVRPKTFHGAIDGLESQGLVERSADGAHERVSLTETGKSALREQFEWMTDTLAD